MSYGMLEGELDADDSVVKALYQCTLCRDCHRRCPSKVKVPDIVRAARADLVEKGLAYDAHKSALYAGTSPDGGLSWTLPKLLGHERAMRFLLELEMVDAEDALSMGLVGEVVDAGDFDHAFMAYCARIAAVAPIAARQTKRLVTRVGLPPDLDSHLRDELHYAVRALSRSDRCRA